MSTNPSPMMMSGAQSHVMSGPMSGMNQQTSTMIPTHSNMMSTPMSMPVMGQTNMMKPPIGSNMVPPTGNPMLGQQNMFPSMGQPNLMMPSMGQPNMMPSTGHQNLMMPSMGQPNMMPSMGQPNMMLSMGQPNMMPSMGTSPGFGAFPASTAGMSSAQSNLQKKQPEKKASDAFAGLMDFSLGGTSQPKSNNSLI